ncbi:hypothetical protein CRYUN_Cryun41cG0007900 [Craigia yunnanensis]
MSTFPDSFTQLGDDSVESVPHQEDEDSDYAGYDPSQQFDSFVAKSDHPKDSTDVVFASQPYTNGEGFGQYFDGSDCPILPPPTEMEPEEGVSLREWRSRLLNTVSFGESTSTQFVGLEDNILLFVANQEKFHAEADKHYWNAIAELIPNEVPTIEKRGKKDKEKKPSIVVVQGRKPGNRLTFQG